MLTFRDIIESFKLDGDLLKTMTNYEFNNGHSNLQDRKINREFAEEMNFNIKNIGRKSPRDRSIVELLKSPAIMASGFSTKFLPKSPNKLCERLKLIPQEKQSGNNCNKINDEIIAIVDKLLEYKCISRKHHKQFLIECNLLHTMRK